MLTLDIKSGAYSETHKMQISAYGQLAKEMNSDVEFKEDGHEYYKNGRRVYSPSFIINHFLVDDRFFTDQHSAKGTLIHKCTALFDKGKLDFDRVHPSIQSFVLGWSKFRSDHELGRQEDVVIEKSLYSKFGYAGTPDRIYPSEKKYDGLMLVYLKKDSSYDIKVVTKKESKVYFNEFITLLNAYKIIKKRGVK